MRLHVPDRGYEVFIGAHRSVNEQIAAAGAGRVFFLQIVYGLKGSLRLEPAFPFFADGEDANTDIGHRACECKGQESCADKGVVKQDKIHPPKIELGIYPKKGDSAVRGHMFGNIFGPSPEGDNNKKALVSKGFFSLHLKEEVIMLSSDTCF
jgi:hypothetical protein